MNKPKRRARGRKGARNLFLILPAIAIVAAISVGGVWLIQQLQALRCPPGTFFAGSGQVASIFQFLPVFFASIGLGFMIVNWLAHLIKPVREFFDRDAERHGAPSYRNSQVGLWRCSAAVSIVAVPIVVAASLSQFCMSGDAILYQPRPWTGLKHYRWDDVAKIETGCHLSKGSWSGSFLFTMSDGYSFDIMAWPRAALHAYPDISRSLANADFAFDATQVSPNCSGPYADMLKWRP